MLAWVGGALGLVVVAGDVMAVEPPPAVPASPGSPRPQCAATAEFLRLGPWPNNYYVRWREPDRNSGYVFWSREWGGNDVRPSTYRWSPRTGIQVIDAEAPSGQADNTFVLISEDGKSALGWSSAFPGFRWTFETGSSPLDFGPSAMTPDGKKAVGIRGLTPVRWSVGGQSTEIDPTWSGLLGNGFDPWQLKLSDSGDTIVISVRGRTLRWTASRGSFELPRLAQPPSDTTALVVSPDGAVIAGQAGDAGARAFRWTEATGLQDLGDLPGAPAGASAQATKLSADGTVITGLVYRQSDNFSHAFRWTAATGMQDLVPGSNSELLYLSPDGNVAIGYLTQSAAPTRTFRWAPDTGAVDIGPAFNFGIGADGDLVVGNTSAGPFISTFGKLAGVQPDLARLLPPGVVPAGWSDPFFEKVSNDGRVLLGTAVNPSGRREPWLMYLRPTSAQSPAGVVEDFDSPSGFDGRALFDCAPAYDGIEDAEASASAGADNDGNATTQNGLIELSFQSLITSDQSGCGYYLHHRTHNDATDYSGEVWGTATPLTVTPHTPYLFSFYLTNENAIDNARIVPFVNNIAIGAAVSAKGTFLTNGWQRFEFEWNSETSTTADLSLRNLTTAGDGNDFAIDTIAWSVAPRSVPALSTTLLAVLSLTLAACGAVLLRPCPAKSSGAA